MNKLSRKTSISCGLYLGYKFEIVNDQGNPKYAKIICVYFQIMEWIRNAIELQKNAFI